MYFIFYFFCSSSDNTKRVSSTLTITEDSTTLKAPMDNGVTSDTSLSEDQIPLLTNSFSKDDTWVLNSNNLNR